MKRPGPLPASRPRRPSRPPEPVDADRTGPIPLIPDEPGAADVVGGGVSGLRGFSERPESERTEQNTKGTEEGAGHPPLRSWRTRTSGQGDTADTAGSGDEDQDGASATRADSPAGGIGWGDVRRAGRARRRALRAEARRFTARTRKRRWYWLGSLGAVLLLVVGTLAAAYSPLFAVRDIRIVGAQSLDAGEIADALDGELGAPMPLVDHSAIRAALLEFPLIETYQVESHPPHQLVVRIVERTPVGVIEGDAGFTVVDAAGVALSTQENRPEGQPLIDAEGGPSSDSFVAAGQVLRSIPDELHEQVTKVTASSAQDVTLVIGDSDADVVWGSAEDSAMKALVLERVMAERPTDEASVYDVSSPAAVVVR